MANFNSRPRAGDCSMEYSMRLPSVAAGGGATGARCCCRANVPALKEKAKKAMTATLAVVIIQLAFFILFHHEARSLTRKMIEVEVRGSYVREVYDSSGVDGGGNRNGLADLFGRCAQR